MFVFNREKMLVAEKQSLLAHQAVSNLSDATGAGAMVLREIAQKPETIAVSFVAGFVIGRKEADKSNVMRKLSLFRLIFMNV